MKPSQVVEILGVLVVLTGAGFCVAAAWLVCAALACVVAGAFLLAAGIIAIYVASTLDEPAKEVAP